MLRAPQMVPRTPPEETVCFIGDDGQVVVLTSVMNAAPKCYELAGRVLTIYDAGNQPHRQRFAIGDRAIASLRIGGELVVAEIDDQGPVRTTSGLSAYERRI